MNDNEKEENVEKNELYETNEAIDQFKDGDSKTSKPKKLLRVITVIALCLIPIGLIYGCTAGDCIKCTACGADNNRLVFFASGTKDGVSYKSCVGPGAIFGFGLNCKLWPTECVSVEKSRDYNKFSGCINYYNGCGCIDRSEVKSDGTYSDQATCGGCSCSGDKYHEVVADTTKATSSKNILACDCGDSSSVNPKYYNSIMPRAFSHGCWTKE